MKKLFYILILISFWACQKPNHTEKNLLDSSRFLIEEQQNHFNYLLAEIREREYNNGMKNGGNNEYAYAHFISHDTFNLDSVLVTVNSLLKEHQLEVWWLENKDSLKSAFEYKEDTLTPKELTLHQLKKLNLSIEFFTTILEKLNTRYQYDSEFTLPQEYELLTELDKSSYSIGDTLKMKFFFYQNGWKYIQKDKFPNLLLNGKPITQENFSFIATCDDSKPCEKKLKLQYTDLIHSQGDTAGTITKYTVIP